MSWVTDRLGADAIINAGLGAKDRVREAIQRFSNVKSRTVYLFSGWCKIGDEHVYLCSGGAIGSHGFIRDVETRLPDKYAKFTLAEPLEGTALEEAFEASSHILRLGPIRIVGPVYCQVFRAVLGWADFTVYEIGRTGRFKTELALLAMRHFGATFQSLDLLTWNDTANS